MRSRALLLFLSVLCLGFAHKPPLSIRFYVLAGKGDTESFSAPMTLLNGQQAAVDQIASISEDDVVAIYPFPTANGTYGCALKLDTHGTVMLEQVSNDKRGSLLVATIDGRQIADIYVDQRVTDGVVTIPTGIKPEELKEMLKKYPVLGAGKKAKVKSKYDEGLI